LLFQLLAYGSLDPPPGPPGAPRTAGRRLPLDHQPCGHGRCAARDLRAQRRAADAVVPLVRRLVSSSIEAGGSLLRAPAGARASLASLGARSGKISHKKARRPPEFASPHRNFGVGAHSPQLATA